MSTALDTRPDTTNTGTDGDLVHIYCAECYPLGGPQLALCGHDCTDDPEYPADWDENLCVVCADLENLPCEGCGA